MTPSVATNLLNGVEMKTETQSQPQDRHRGAMALSLPFALFVVCELVCTGVLVASVILWS